MTADHLALIQAIVLIVQTLVLIGTGILVWRYTNATENYTAETGALRAETVRQTKLSLRPIVLPGFPEVEGVLGFRLENCGTGCAINVVITPFGTDRYEGAKFKFGHIESRFEPQKYLASGASAPIYVLTLGDGQLLRGPTMFDLWFHPCRPGPETSIEILFDDIEGRRYRVWSTITAEFDWDKLPRDVRVGTVEELKA